MSDTIEGGEKILADGSRIPWIGFDGKNLIDPFTAIVERGNLTPQWQPGFDLEWSDEGLCVRTDRIACNEDDIFTQIAGLPKYATHRKIATLGLERLRVRGDERGGNECLIEAIYAGIAGSTAWPPTEETISNTSTEPIETWHGFKIFSGLPDDPKDYTIVDDDGNFKGFTADAPSGMCGVDSWLVPNTVLRRKWCQKKRPETLGIVGRLSGVSGAPIINGLWFLSGLTYVRRGLAYCCAADFMDTGANIKAALLLYG